jgi:hypothetical protein
LSAATDALWPDGMRDGRRPVSSLVYGRRSASPLVYRRALAADDAGRAGCRDGSGCSARRCRSGISADGRHAGSMRIGGLSVNSMIRETWCAGMGRIPLHQPETFGCGIPSRCARRLPDILDRAIRARNSAGVILPV